MDTKINKRQDIEPPIFVLDGSPEDSERMLDYFVKLYGIEDHDDE